MNQMIRNSLRDAMDDLHASPGYVEYACRMSIRDLIAELGEDAARERIRDFFGDETRRANRKREMA